MKEFRLLELIGEIKDEWIEDAVQVQPVPKRRLFSVQRVAIGVCAAVVLCVGLLVYTQVQHRSDITQLPEQTSAATEESVQIANPFQECDSLETAEQIAGFSLSVPDSCADSTNSVIQAVEADMIEVIYQDSSENEVARIRKAVGKDEISGDYNLYENDSVEDFAGVSVHVRGNGNLWYAADWTDGTYAYSITVESGVASEALETWIRQVQ